jgi:hypothetical protein
VADDRQVRAPEQDAEGRDSELGTEGDSALLADAWKGLHGQIARESGIAGRLRRLTLPVRIAIAVGVATMVPAAAAMMMLRSDFALLSMVREGVTIGVVLVLTGAAAALAAWPVHVAPVSRTRIFGLAGATVALALVLALAPELHDPEPSSLAALLTSAVRCSAMGLAAALPVGIVAYVLRRDAPGAMVGAGALAGLSLLVTLSLTCGYDSVSHLLLGHAAPVALVVVAALILQNGLRRSAPRPS